MQQIRIGNPQVTAGESSPMGISHLKSLGKAAYEIGEFLLVSQQVYIYEIGAALRKATVVLWDRLPVAPVAPCGSPLVPNALRERLFAALGQLCRCRSAKPTPKCAPRADPPLSCDDHECVGARNQEVLVDIVAVDDPPLARE